MDTCKEFDHWEADHVIGKKNGDTTTSLFLHFLECITHGMLIFRIDYKTPESVMAAFEISHMIRYLIQSRQATRQSLRSCQAWKSYQKPWSISPFHIRPEKKALLNIITNFAGDSFKRESVFPAIRRIRSTVLSY